MEDESILSMLALFYGLFFFYLCSIIDCTKLSCSAKLRYIYFHLSADILTKIQMLYHLNPYYYNLVNFVIYAAGKIKTTITDK